MRIKITLSLYKPGIIDFNYQHQIQALIYGFLSRSNPDYSQWLHEQGYLYKKDKQFKLFVFSGITFHKPVKVIRSCGLNSSDKVSNSDGFWCKGSENEPFTCSFQIASPVNQFLHHLIDGIFREGNKITLGRQKMLISGIEILPSPLYNMGLRPLESPIFIKKPMPPGQKDIYLFPGDEGYETFLNQNLLHKYETLYNKSFIGGTLKFNFHTGKDKPVKHFTIFKKGLDGIVRYIHIKGTLQPFTVSGPEELIKIGLVCGFGQNNSMGCGYVEGYG
ncbi:MAG: CRISPR-associated endoribonuclease Cas6 [wastewater metagenome]|nr:CRISPR-associated endoribonuclease Cas6 [Candidatus Loosdrechtia aerotolerans]